MDVTPYHNLVNPNRKRPEGAKPHVYHDRTDCPIGSKIPPQRRVYGKDKRLRCEKCKVLGRTGIVR
jgi:hypothetical protein